ncbi:MAG TPA: hypothetical protein VMH81_04195 [Bryobacteraceae bacterium]|nr:hypothetical protein [Bryobacteraceae bacterium]
MERTWLGVTEQVGNLRQAQLPILQVAQAEIAPYAVKDIAKRSPLFFQTALQRSLA